MILNALRCGVTFPQLLEVLPAVDAAELLASYTQLHDALRDAREHWKRILANPTLDTLAESGPAAALILPVPVHRIGVAVRTIANPRHAASAVASVEAEVTRVTFQAHQIEERLAVLPAGTGTGVRLGQSLHDVARPGVWTHPYFLPCRVGELSTTSVVDLRGDDRR